MRTNQRTPYSPKGGTAACPTLIAALHAVVCIVFLFAGSEVQAQQFAAPSLCPEEGACQPPSEGLYDLSGFDIPFSVSLPISPNISRTIRVPQEMSLGAAAAISGAHIIVSAGTYNGFQINRSDQWFDLDDNAVITGTLDVARAGGQARTMFSGGQIIGERVNFSGGALDFVFDNVRMELVQGFYPGGAATASTRVAFLNSTIRAGRYATFTYAIIDDQDYLYANMNIVGGLTSPQAAMRLMTTRNLVIVDSRIRQDATAGGNYLLRLHGTTTNVFVSENQFEPSGPLSIWGYTHSGDNSGGDISFVYVRGNRFYQPATGFHAEVQMTPADGDNIYDIWVEDNQVFSANTNASDTFGVIETGGSVARTDYTPNTKLPYTGTPVFTGGADH